MLKKEKCEAAEQHNMLQLSTTITRQRIAPRMYWHNTTHGVMARIAANIVKSFCRLFRMVTASLQKPPQSIIERQNKETATLEKRMLLTLYSAEFLGQIAQKNKMLLKKPIRFESLVPLPGRKALLLQLLQSGRHTKIDSLAPAASLPVTCSLKSLADMMKL
jgi:hypothetical protein